MTPDPAPSTDQVPTKRKRKWKVKTLVGVVALLVIAGIFGPKEPPKQASATPSTSPTQAAVVTQPSTAPTRPSPSPVDDAAVRSAAVAAAVAALSGKPGYPGDPDFESCRTLVADILGAQKRLEAAINANQIDYPNASAEISTYTAEVEQAAPEFVNPALRAAWGRAGTNGETAAQLLLEGDPSTADAAASTWALSVTAAIQVCRTYMHH